MLRKIVAVVVSVFIFIRLIYTVDKVFSLVLSQFLVWGSFVCLLLLFFLSFRRVEFQYLKNNIYGNRMFFVVLISLLSFLWVPKLDDAMEWIIRLIVYFLSSYALYYFIQKYKLFTVVVNIVLFASYINYSLALDLSVFSFLKAEAGSNLPSRFQGTEINPNFLAVFLVFSIFLSLLYFQQLIEKKQIKKTNIVSLFHLGNVLLALYTILLTASRKGLLASILLITAFLALNLLKFANRKTALYFAAIAGGVIIFFSIDTFNDELAVAFERNVQLLMFWTNDGGGAVGESIERRSLYIEKGWEGFIKRPFFGHGLNAFQYYNGVYAHNNYVELLFDLGFFGFIAYYSIHFSILRRLYRHKVGTLIAVFIFILIFIDVAAVSFVDFKGMLMLVTVMLLSNRAINNKLSNSNG